MTSIRFRKTAADGLSRRRARRSRGHCATLSPGVLVGGRFRVCFKVATGGMGEVWSGEHCTTGMRVALKTLLPELSKSHEAALRFKREAELLGRVRSDRVARVVDFVIEPERGPVLVTEFVDGRSLAAILVSERLRVEEAVELGIEIAIALRELHRAHIVHRDLKPGNVILQPPEDGRMRAVLVDLGVSRLVLQGTDDDRDELTAITQTQVVLGTMAYMAPEQILRAREATEAADLYALGAILFRSVTGRQVFSGLPTAHLVQAKLRLAAPRLETGRTDRIASGFQAVVSRALESDPVGRYTTADEMLTDLLRLRALRDTGCMRADGSCGPSPRLLERRSPGRTTYVAIVTLALAAGGAGLSFARTMPSPSSSRTKIETESTKTRIVPPNDVVAEDSARRTYSPASRLSYVEVQ